MMNWYDVVLAVAVLAVVGSVLATAYIFGRMDGMMKMLRTALDMWSKHVNEWPDIPSTPTDELEKYGAKSNGMGEIVEKMGDEMDREVVPDWLRSKGAL